MKPILNKELLRRRILQKQLKEKFEARKVRKFLAIHIFWLFLVWFFIIIWLIYLIYLRDLPEIWKLGDSVLPENTVIYDKNWGVLYNLYSKEKRTYVNYENISKNMKDAIVSTEDKTFFENSWFDVKWLIRAGLNYITWKSDKIQWTSTISQQLIKVSYLTNERSLKRKIQEVFLSYKMNNSFSKEKILELYLNKIEYWSNAYWIEEASKTFFWKWAKDLNILESSIMASIPKWPTYYSPYNHSDRLVWYASVYKSDTPKDIIKVVQTENPTFYNPLQNKLKSIITDMTITKDSDKVKVCKLDSKFFKKDFSIDSSWCIKIDASKLLELLNAIIISYNDLNIEKPNEDLADYVMEYNTWRKDFVLWRMLEDDKISAEEYKKAIIDSLEIKFKKYSENIKYPFFVFYVKEYLEQQDFGNQWWLRIYTTIDPKLQDKAEELVKKQVAINKDKYWASNAALVSIDNRNWWILSMVWWVDYFDWSKWANVNIITSERQPGSSFKPIVYANAIANNPISPETPIYDSDTKFGDREPNNYDSKFLWMIPIRKALDYSRNIPAIKIFFYGWWENVIVKFANLLWISSIKLWANYGWPLAIWAWELKPLELAWAYAIFANWWVKKEITPILKIEDKKWNMILDNTPKSNNQSWNQIFSAAASYILSKILSDASSRPNQYRNNVLTLKDRKVAAKTGTSNKDVSVGKKKIILPGDLWTAWYTPQITTVVWAWNTDWSATKWTCDWLNCAAPIWHDYMEFAHKWLPVVDFKEPEWIYHVTISKMSGKLVTDSTPTELRTTSIFAVKPTEYDWGYKSIKVDSLCNWLVTDSTPEEAIKTIYLWWSTNPIIESSNKEWLKNLWRYQSFTETWSWSSSDIKDTPCDRPSWDTSGISLSSNLVNWENLSWIKDLDIRFDAKNPIIKITISVNWKIEKTIPVKESVSWNITEVLNVKEWPQTIVISAVDKFYYSSKVSYKINPSTEDTTSNTGENITWSNTVTKQPIVPVSAPVITMTNPIEWDDTLQLYQNISANIRGKVTWEWIDTINVYLNGKLYKVLDWANSFIVPINEAKDFAAWEYSLKIEAIDWLWKKWIKIVNIIIMWN